MKVELVFPSEDFTDERLEVFWNKSFTLFPCYVMRGLVKYEMVMYDHDKNNSNKVIAYYGRISPQDSRWYSEKYTDVLELVGKNNGCECGAKHTSFPDQHMMFCSLWRPFK